MMEDMKIDIVYTWVDGSDPKWLEKREQYSGEIDHSNKESFSRCRYIQSDELKYSLRSVEKFAQWVNNIFIITDDQIPKWLDTTNPKIKIVDHKDIIPNEALPVFNSQIIEMYMANISGLSEHFIYANDDTLIARDVAPDFFFDSDGKPIVRLRKQNLKKYIRRSSDYAKVIYRCVERIKNDFGKEYYFAPHHNMDAYTKSTYKEVVTYYNQWLQETLSSRFRTPTDMQRYVVTLYSIVKGGSTYRVAGRTNRANSLGEKIKCWLTGRFKYDTRIIPIDTKSYDKVFKNYDPILFCMNDYQRATGQDRRRAGSFLEKMFPEKSSFEK